MLIISAHGDTNFKNHSLERGEHGLFKGHLDNFIGVYAVMQAYFSGRLNTDLVRIEITHGEETDFGGARRVASEIGPEDLVLVVDVTATLTESAFVIEKCKNPELQSFLFQALHGQVFDMYDDCPDPVADEDECDVYSTVSPYTCFLGIPVGGGDYNQEKVYSSDHHIRSVAEAICLISEHYARTR